MSFSFIPKLPVTDSVPEQLMGVKTTCQCGSMASPQEDVETALHGKLTFCQTCHLGVCFGFCSDFKYVQKTLKDVSSYSANSNLSIPLQGGK